MNLFYELFYKLWISTAFYPMPVEHWLFFSTEMASFPTIEILPGFTQSSRRTKKIQLIVIHHTGSLDINKALVWYKNPNTYSSTHFVIDLDGFIQQLVSLENASLHTPNALFRHSRLVNEMSIGISLVGNGSDRFTEAQYEAISMLCTYLKTQYGLKNEDIYLHSEVDCTPMVFDPTPWSKEKFNEMLVKFENL